MISSLRSQHVDLHVHVHGARMSATGWFYRELFARINWLLVWLPRSVFLGGWRLYALIACRWAHGTLMERLNTIKVQSEMGVLHCCSTSGGFWVVFSHGEKFKVQTKILNRPTDPPFFYLGHRTQKIFLVWPHLLGSVSFTVRVFGWVTFSEVCKSYRTFSVLWGREIVETSFVWKQTTDVCTDRVAFLLFFGIRKRKEQEWDLWWQH